MAQSGAWRSGKVAAAALAWLAAVAAWPRAGAIIFSSTSDPAHNAAAPTGALADSGWQWEGNWGGLLGTAVAPDFFLTAGHVGGGLGQAFNYNGQSFLAVAAYSAPGADLRLWRVAGTMPSFAPIYSGTSEPGLGVVMFGNGTQRGDPVMVNGKLKGWVWGPVDAVMRWGTNRISEIVDLHGAPKTEGAPEAGDQLACAFQNNAGAEEGTLSSGDSGGGVFARDGGKWKLVGINKGVEAGFRLTADGPDFSAAIFDRGGLFEFGPDLTWQLVPDRTADIPAAFVAVRLSGNVTWIQNVLSGQVAADKTLSVEGSDFIEGPYALETEAQFQPAKSQFLVPMTGGSRFWRLRSDYQVNIRSFSVVGTNVELRFGLGDD